MKNKLPAEPDIIQKGAFYSIKDNVEYLILEDSTKRGLEIKNTTLDEKLNVNADKGRIHDMDGIGHEVPIRWYFPKKSFKLEDVDVHAKALEDKYTKLRELTCPD